MSIVRENNISLDDVAEVIVHVDEYRCNIVGKPFEIRETPTVDAQFSIPYTVSVAIARRNVFIDDFFEQKIKADTEVLQLARKVTVVGDQGPFRKGIAPSVVDVKTKDGKVHSHRVEMPRGDPGSPVSMAEIADKFRKCAAFSAKPISGKNVDKVIEAVSELESVENINKITRLLA